MSGTYKFHGSASEVVPFQAQYMFPTQQTKIHKHLIKLPPKNGGEFIATQTMRIEFPSDNYLNVLNSVLQFDVESSVDIRPVQKITAANNDDLTADGGTTIVDNANDFTPGALVGCTVFFIDKDSGWW